MAATTGTHSCPSGSLAWSSFSLPSPINPVTSPHKATLPVPMPITPPGALLVDLSRLFSLQVSPYLLSSVCPSATGTAATSASSSSSLVGLQTVLTQPGLQPSPQDPGYLPSLRLQQHAFPQAMAPALLLPLQHRQQPQPTCRPQPPLSHQTVAGDGTSDLEWILSRAEQLAQEKKDARHQACRREKSEPHYGAPRIKRRRTSSPKGRDDYSPDGGGQRQSTSGDDRHGRPFCSSSSGSSDNDDDHDERDSSSIRGSSQAGVMGIGGKEILCQRRQASPKQVVLLERVFAAEPFPTSATKRRLSEVLRMSPKRVAVWFKNKRARKKKGIPLAPLRLLVVRLCLTIT